jgi:hypothetical protein
MENFDDNFREQTQRGESHPRDDPFNKEAFAARKKQERDAVYAPCRFAVSEDLPENRNALYQREQNTIFARSGVDGDACFQSVSQELALACMEHSGKGLAAPAFAAYCVSYMVCKRHGVDVDRSGFDHLPEVYQAMGTKTFRAELGAIKEISGDRIIEMRRFLDAQEKAHRHRDDGAR